MYPMAHHEFSVAVDLVILTVDADVLKVLCVRRGIAPAKGRLALPGGFVLADEDLPDAAVRELGEETGLRDVGGHLEQLATYGHPKRDPRGRVISVAYLALVPDLPEAVAGSDAADAGSADRTGLDNAVRRALQARIDELLTRPEPLLLTGVGLLGRYRAEGWIADLANLATERPASRWRRLVSLWAIR